MPVVVNIPPLKCNEMANSTNMAKRVKVHAVGK